MAVYIHRVCWLLDGHCIWRSRVQECSLAARKEAPHHANIMWRGDLHTKLFLFVREKKKIMTYILINKFNLFSKDLKCIFSRWPPEGAQRMVPLQNVTAQNVTCNKTSPLQNGTAQNVTSQNVTPQNVTSHKTSPATKRHQPQNVTSHKTSPVTKRHQNFKKNMGNFHSL